tara:strand:- start:5927 stop:6589 length:663 start_codon:yes stop_codon:yes gene_type:complete
MIRNIFLLFFCILSFSTASAWADSFRDIKKKYSGDLYLVGIAEVQISNDPFKDRRRAEALARLEIAKQIKIRIKGTTVDKMCEGQGRALFATISECKNQFSVVVEETVEEVLVDSRIVETGEDKERSIFYAVAVLPRKDAATRRAEDGFSKSIIKAKEYLNKAKESENEKIKKERTQEAKEELLKGIAYEGERAAIVKTRSEEVFKYLVKEINKIEGNIQ